MIDMPNYIGEDDKLKTQIQYIKRVKHKLLVGEVAF